MASPRAPAAWNSSTAAASKHYSPNTSAWTPFPVCPKSRLADAGRSLTDPMSDADSPCAVRIHALTARTLERGQRAASASERSRWADSGW